METAYTECDIQAEKGCQDCLLKLEQNFKAYHSLMKSEMNIQKNVCDKLWVLVQRILILQCEIPFFENYPTSIGDRIICELLRDFQTNVAIIFKSNKSLQTQLNIIKLLCKSFDENLKNLDFRTESPFLKGSAKQKPIFYYVELTHDIFTYFKKILSQLKIAIEFIQTNDLEGIEKYQELLKLKNYNFYEDSCFMMASKKS